MADVDSGSTDAGRDSQGRFVPGHSGNPEGRGPGRPSEEVNALADRGIQAVLEHDLGVLEDKRAPARAREKALDRLARVGARRVAGQRQSVELSTPADEARVRELKQVLVDGWERQAARIRELEAIVAGKVGLGADGEEGKG